MVGILGTRWFFSARKWMVRRCSITLYWLLSDLLLSQTSRKALGAQKLVYHLSQLYNKRYHKTPFLFHISWTIMAITLQLHTRKRMNIHLPQLILWSIPRVVYHPFLKAHGKGKKSPLAVRPQKTWTHSELQTFWNQIVFQNQRGIIPLQTRLIWPITWRVTLVCAETEASRSSSEGM